MLWRYGLVLGLVIVVLVGAMLLDWRFIRRALTYPQAPIMAAEWYQPKQMVPGNPQPFFPPTSAPVPPALTAALTQVANYARDRNSTGLIVLHRGEVLLEQYWQGYDAHSVFNAMSMSKTVVGLLIGIAIAEGAIPSLDTPASVYLPEWQGDDRARITLHDLLAMQSGLRNERNTTRPTSDLVQMYMGSDVAKIALSIPAVMPPGQRFDYNNVNSQVLAIVLERATGMAYEDYLSSRLWQPLGATTASIWRDRPEGMAKTFCCLFATARDWARLGQLLLHEGRIGDRQIVPPDWIQTLRQPSPLEATAGKHLWVKARTPDHPNVDVAATEPFRAADTFYLDGRGVQRVYVIPSHDLVIVRMGEQPPDWDDAVIPNRLVAALSEQ